MLIMRSSLYSKLMYDIYTHIYDNFLYYFKIILSMSKCLMVWNYLLIWSCNVINV